MLILRVIFSILIAYTFGCIQSSIILSLAFKKKDIRTVGSCSAGATNMFRSFGAKWGVITLIADSFMGFLSFWIGFGIGSLGGAEYAELCAALASIAAVCGHNWPAFYGFKGGKGIATSLGIMFAVNPLIALVCLVVGIGIAFITRYMSVGSLAAVFVVIIFIFFVDPAPYKLMLTFIVVSSVIQHRANIVRLFQGKENPVISRSLIDRIKGTGGDHNSKNNTSKTNKRNLK